MNTTTRTEQINGFTISLEHFGQLHFVKIIPGMMFCRGSRNQESSFIENDPQSARDRVQALKQYAKTNPL